MHALTRLATAPRSAKCPHCGGETSLDSRSLKPTCEWCGATLASLTDSTTIQAEELAPALLTPAAAKAAVELWIKTSSEEVPPDFASRAKVLKIEAAFYPFYLFSGVYSGSRGNSMVSGGFLELIPGSGELSAIQVHAPLSRFFAPPSNDVTLEDLSTRVMNELIEERRRTVHTDFCRHVINKATPAVLEKLSAAPSSDIPRHAFTEAYEVAEQRLKQTLCERTRVKDIFFQELKTRRILWPFFVAELSCLGFKYFCFVDASSPRPDYIGGYKPINPQHKTATVEQVRDGDLGDLLETWASSSSTTIINGHTFTGDAAVEKMKEVRTLMESLSNSPSDSKSVIKLDVKRAGCFIATAAYGSEWSDEVAILRRFRDEILLNTRAGRVFVDVYYSVSPPLARAISVWEPARAFVRCALHPIIKFCRHRLS